MPKLSIIVPVKNEEKNIEKLVTKVHSAISSNDITYELLFIDDHSTDNTTNVVKELQKKYPIRIFAKQGKAGKGYSIIEGVQHAKYDLICMIDADLQYDPKHIPEILAKIESHDDVGVVVAERKTYNGTLFRKLGSRLNAFVIGRLMFKLNHDIQSGLKIFRKEIVKHIDTTHVGPWSFDVPLLHTAKELGYRIRKIHITFEHREGGESKINMLSVSKEIVSNAVKLKLSGRKIYPIEPTSSKNMIGAGMIHKGKRYITHTVLPHHDSAIHTLKRKQGAFIVGLIGLITLAATFNPVGTIIGVMAVLNLMYFFDMMFNLNMILRSLKSPSELHISDEKIASLQDKELPIYTILCPLYREAHMIPQFVEAISKLDWPKDKLDVMLLLEEDDKPTIAAAENIKLPSFVRIVVVPDSQPKTKPKATNYGLAHAKGEYVVIFDAEDMPDEQQLKKVFIAFQESPKNVVCMQAKLNYYNPRQNLLTRIFTAEYSLWFDLILTGLQSMQAPIPLGGTSNHFKITELTKLKGWDSFNVTEDCDLGIRLAKYGYKTAIVDSVTLEEANSQLFNWIHQRSRWIKGYIQSYLVHMRRPLKFFKEDPRNFLAFQLTVGGKILSLFVNPFMWLITILYFTFRATMGITIEKFFPAPVLYMAVLSLVFGNFLYLYYYMIGCAKRNQWQLIKYIYIVPFYWLAMSFAAWKALIQLMYKPHFWAKTVHGLHFDTTAQALTEVAIPVQEKPLQVAITKPAAETKKTWTFGTVSSGTVLVLGYMTANLLNFLFNLSLGRLLSFENFGLLTFVNTFTYLISILLFSLASTLTHRISFLTTKYGKEAGVIFLRNVYAKSLQITVAVAVVWTLLIPLMMVFFRLDTVLPLLMFYPILFLGLLSTLNEGFLQGNFFFISLALVTISAPLIKLVLGLTMAYLGFEELVYLVIPISSVMPVFVSAALVYYKIKKIPVSGVTTHYRFPRRFFTSSMLSILSLNLFLTMDVLLTKHYLTITQVGEYALIGLIGKMVFYFGSILTNFMTAFVSRDEGAKRNPARTFNLLLSGTVLFTVIIFTLIGPLGSIINPILFGDKVLPVLSLITPYALAMSLLTVASAILTYHIARHHYIFPVVSLLSSFTMIIGIYNWHSSVEDIVYVTLFASTLNLVLMLLLHGCYRYSKWVKMNIKDFLSLFVNSNINLDTADDKQRILFFNWYCVRHKYAGGAEYYLHNIAKSLVKKGHSVTFFCGNDGKLPSSEIIDGVQIVRHGGLFTVSIWGFIYYITKFKHYYDVVIDSAKGVPFFTPLYVKQPVISVICHVHADMFKKELPMPLAQVAIFLETKAMPTVYRAIDIVTISPSIKKLLKKMGYGVDNTIHIVYPGVNEIAPLIKKTTHPSLIYLGRLREYKHVDVLIRMAAKLKEEFPTLQVTVAGDGESTKKLTQLSEKLRVRNMVTFTGKISEKEKEKLLAKSWIAIHPSIAEGWGITNIEANLCGTPVVASDIDGLRDSVVNGKTGYLVKPMSVEAFYIATRKLLHNHKLRERMAMESIIWAQNFSWDASADDFYDVFHKMIIKQDNEFNKATRLERANVRV
jgi:cellulose synthase/poly-beta-1,6-N-acetylglucosamine synthase-like glycosyltransferase/glycosyltransferase involved in cell wall biosynthesis/O-antigen/teichoic acid export membrane protein